MIKIEELTLVTVSVHRMKSVRFRSYSGPNAEKCEPE